VKCNEISDKLSLYIDNELSHEEMQQVEEHLLSCEKCQKILDEYKNLISVLRNLPEEEPPVGYCKRLHEKFIKTCNT
jgi:anti-sigma factor RsiW